MRQHPLAYIVGVGPGSEDYLTPNAVRAIKDSEIILGWELDFAPVKPFLRRKEIYLQNVRNFSSVARDAVKRSRKTGKTMAVLRIGDPCVSSGLGEMLEMLKGFRVVVVPGISSTQLGAAIAGINIDDSVTVSFHDYGDQDAEKLFMSNSFKIGKHIIVLTSPDLRPCDAADYLMKSGASESVVAYVCSNLSFKDQKVIKASLARIAKMENFHWLSLIVIVNPSAPTPYEAKKAWESWRESRLNAG